MRIFIGMETSGELRRRFGAMGHQVISVDTLPADDRSTYANGYGHIQGDVFQVFEWLYFNGFQPDAAIFHPTCTYLTNSAEWAFADADLDRYPGVGYHQRVKPDTLTGALRRAARRAAVDDVKRIIALPIPRIIIENPRGHLSAAIGKPSDTVQPYEFGDDASKATCLWAFLGGRLISKGWKVPRDPKLLIPPTLRPNGKRYWANQTDTGQNRLSPGEDRWKQRSKTFPGIADALAKVLVA